MVKVELDNNSTSILWANSLSIDSFEDSLTLRTTKNLNMPLRAPKILQATMVVKKIELTFH